MVRFAPFVAIVVAVLFEVSAREIQVLKHDPKSLRLDIDNDELKAMEILENLMEGIPDKDAEIKMFQMDNEGSGNFSVQWETSDGKSVVYQRGYLKPAIKNSDPNRTEERSKPDGRPIKIEYVANEAGFKPKGESIPTVHPIPAAIQRSLNVIYNNFHGGNQTACALRDSGPAVVIFSEITLDKSTPLPAKSIGETSSTSAPTTLAPDILESVTVPTTQLPQGLAKEDISDGGFPASKDESLDSSDYIDQTSKLRDIVSTTLPVPTSILTTTNGLTATPEGISDASTTLRLDETTTQYPTLETNASSTDSMSATTNVATAMDQEQSLLMTTEMVELPTTTTSPSPPTSVTTKTTRFRTTTTPFLKHYYVSTPRGYRSTSTSTIMTSNPGSSTPEASKIRSTVPPPKYSSTTTPFLKHYYISTAPGYKSTSTSTTQATSTPRSRTTTVDSGGSSRMPKSRIQDTAPPDDDGKGRQKSNSSSSTPFLKHYYISTTPRYRSTSTTTTQATSTSRSDMFPTTTQSSKILTTTAEAEGRDLGTSLTTNVPTTTDSIITNLPENFNSEPTTLQSNISEISTTDSEVGSTTSKIETSSSNYTDSVTTILPTDTLSTINPESLRLEDIQTTTSSGTTPFDSKDDRTTITTTNPDTTSQPDITTERMEAKNKTRADNSRNLKDERIEASTQEDKVTEEFSATTNSAILKPEALSTTPTTAELTSTANPESEALTTLNSPGSTFSTESQTETATQLPKHKADTDDQTTTNFDPTTTATLDLELTSTTELATQRSGDITQPAPTAILTTTESYTATPEGIVDTPTTQKLEETTTQYSRLETNESSPESMSATTNMATAMDQEQSLIMTTQMAELSTTTTIRPSPPTAATTRTTRFRIRSTVPPTKYSSTTPRYRSTSTTTTQATSTSESRTTVDSRGSSRMPKSRFQDTAPPDDDGRESQTSNPGSSTPGALLTTKPPSRFPPEYTPVSRFTTASSSTWQPTKSPVTKTPEARATVNAYRSTLPSRAPWTISSTRRPGDTTTTRKPLIPTESPGDAAGIKLPDNVYLPPLNSSSKVPKLVIPDDALRLPDGNPSITPRSSKQIPSGRTVSPAKREISNIMSVNQNYGNGTYVYAYENSDGSMATQTGFVKDPLPGERIPIHAVKGVYRWMSPEGIEQKVQYTADENGYQAQGDGLPTSPPIPKEIQRSLNIIYRNAELQKRKRSQPQG